LGFIIWILVFWLHTDYTTFFQKRPAQSIVPFVGNFEGNTPSTPKFRKSKTRSGNLEVKVETEGGAGAPKSGQKERNSSLIGQKLFSLLSLILYLYTIEIIQFNDPRKYLAISSSSGFPVFRKSFGHRLQLPPLSPK